MAPSPADTLLLELCVAAGALPPDAIAAARRAVAEGKTAREALAEAGAPAELLASLEEAALRSGSPGPAPTAGPPTMVAGEVATGETAPVVRKIGRYVVGGELGRGGMGVVYRARDPGLGRDVALKTLLVPGEPQLAERFLREARAAARLGKHTNLVQVFDAGEADDVLYITMELVEGRGYDRELREGVPTPRRAAEVAEQVARGLAHAHANGVIHRDLKPANVLIDRAGRALLTDFGLARDTAQRSGLSVDGQVFGTPAYMSPEQAAGRVADVDARSDVYGAGAILYESLAGRAPVEADGMVELLRRVIEEDVVPPSRFAPSVPRELESVCLKAMDRDPARRYATAAELADDLGRFLAGEPVLARPQSRLRAAARRLLRRRAAVAGAALLLVLASGFALFARPLLRKIRDTESARAAAAAAEKARGEAAALVAAARPALEAATADRDSSASRDESQARLRRALLDLDRAVALDPGSFDALILRARGRRADGRVREALEDAERALAARPADLEALYEKTLANIELLRRDRGTAWHVDYTHAVTLGSYGRRTTFVGGTGDVARRRESVRADVRRLVENGLAPARASYCEASLLAADGKDLEALPRFDQAIAQDAFFVEAHVARAEVLSRAKPEEALEAWRKIHAARPWDARVMYQLAEVETSGSRQLELLEKAMALAPGEADFVARLGTYLCDRRQFEEGLLHLRRALEMDPLHPGALNNLFATLVNMGDFEAAEAFLPSLLAMPNYGPDVAFGVAMFRLEYGRADLALPWILKASEADPGFYIYGWVLGQCRIMTGDIRQGVIDILDAVGSVPVGEVNRKAFEQVRAGVERQLPDLTSPRKVAKLARGLAGGLRLLQAGAGTERGKTAYLPQINALEYLAGELYEVDGRWKEARAARGTITIQGPGSWGSRYRNARCWAREGKPAEALADLRQAHEWGLLRLGIVRMDAGFDGFRKTAEYRELEAEFEADQTRPR